MPSLKLFLKLQITLGNADQIYPISCKKNLRSLENSAQLLSALQQDKAEALTEQIAQINAGQIKLEVLLKGYTAEEAAEWIIKNPAAEHLEIADFRGFLINDLTNENFKNLAKSCPNLKHCYLGHPEALTPPKITGDALNYLEHLPNLESLGLCYLRHLDPDALKNLQFTPKLKWLEIVRCYSLAPDSLKNLEFIRNLEHLIANLTEIDSLKPLTFVSKLLSLDISNNSQLGPQELDNLVYTPQLEVLRCSEKFAPDAMKNLVHTPKLRVLNISGCPNLDRDCLDNLKYIPNLEELMMSYQNLEPEALKNLVHIPKLKTFKLTDSDSLEPDALKHLEYTPFLLELGFRTCSTTEPDVLKYLKFTEYLQKLDIRFYNQPGSRPFEHLTLTPNLQSLDFTWFYPNDPYALKPIMHHPNLKTIIHDSKNIISKDLLPLAVQRESIAPLQDMSDWDHFIIRDSKWDKLPGYKTTGTQEPYGRRMQQAIIIVTDLVKNKTNFKEICIKTRWLRQIMAIELDHINSHQFGEPRVTYSKTDLTQVIYNEIGTVWKNKDQIIKSSNAVNPFYDPAKAMVIGTIHGKQLELSFINLDTLVLYHTDPDLIPEIMDYAEELYSLAIQENDPTKVHEIAGLFFWWVCQAKPWLRGDPSSAEIIIRAIFASKQIPNLPWKEKLVPWGEATKEFDPTAFSQNFHTLFDKL